MIVLKQFLRDRTPRFIVCWILLLGCSCLFYFEITDIGSVSVYTTHIKLLVLCPCVCLLCLKNILHFLGICLDVMTLKTKTVTAMNVQKPYITESDSYSRTHKKNLFEYCKWKVKSPRGIRYYVLIPKDVNRFHINKKNKNQQYMITYYRFSKIVTNIKLVYD